MSPPGHDRGVENREGRGPAGAPRRQPGSPGEWLKKPQLMLPALVILGMLGLAFGFQPGGSSGAEPARGSAVDPVAGQQTPATPASTPTVAPTQPKADRGTSTPSSTGSPAGGSPAAGAAATNEVAGARSTPSVEPTADPDLAREPTQCGAIQETSMPLAVEQVLSGVSVRATRAAVYPIDYFRCILMATGGREAVALASLVSKAEREGMTHAVLIDLWVTNSARDFGQVNLRTAVVSAAGQAFGPLATLGGRAEVVVSGGQGRNVTLLAAVKNTVGSGTGPITVTIEAPLAGGKQTAGKYQLFLPTP